MRSTPPGMTRACPVGHPSAEGMRHCALCGRAYVAVDQVAPPVSVEQVLADRRVRRRAERAAALSSPSGATDTAADTADNAASGGSPPSSSSSPSHPKTLQPQHDQSQPLSTRPTAEPLLIRQQLSQAVLEEVLVDRLDWVGCEAPVLLHVEVVANLLRDVGAGQHGPPVGAEQFLFHVTSFTSMRYRTLSTHSARSAAADANAARSPTTRQ